MQSGILFCVFVLAAVTLAEEGDYDDEDVDEEQEMATEAQPEFIAGKYTYEFA
jgi:hypothetical protein